MRFVKMLVPTLVALATTFAPASALPVPKLPAEVTNKPSIIVRVRPVDELIKDAAYFAKMVGQGEVFDAVKPAMDPFLDAIDGTKPIGFYAKVGPNGIDSHGVLLVPVKNIKDFVATLNLVNVNAAEGEGGLYTVNAPGSPFPVIFRHVNGYVYATVKNTPDAEAGLAANKVYTPDYLFKKGDDSVLSVTFNVDAIPNDLKKKALEHLEDGLREFRTNEISKVGDAVVRNVLDGVAEEVATKIQLLITDTQTATIRLDLDRAKESLGFGVKVAPRANSDLAADFAVMGSGKSIAAGAIAPGSAASISANVVAPATVKKALDTLFEKVTADMLKNTNDQERPIAKEFTDLIAPTVKAGILDIAADLREPNGEGQATLLISAQMKDAGKLDAFVRKILPFAPAPEQAKVKLDAAKAGDVAVHQLEVPLDGKARELFGENAKATVAFRKDAVVVALGPPADAMAAVKAALGSTSKAAPIAEGVASIRKLAPIMERKDAGAVNAAKKAYPAGIDDSYRLTITGGESLDVRFSMSARIVQFGMLIEQARRGQ